MEKKQTISIKFMAWWNALPPIVQTMTPYIVSGLLALGKSINEGTPPFEAILNFCQYSFGTVCILKGISMTADKQVENMPAKEILIKE